MASKLYEIAFQLGAKLQSSFGNAFSTAQKQLSNLSAESVKVNKGFLGLGEGMGNLAKATIGITGGIGLAEIAKQSIELASDLNEVQNVVDTTFGSNSSEIDAWSKTALNAFGLSELQAKQYTGTLGAMLKSSGITGQGMVSMSENLVGLSGDLASFYNLPIDEAMEKIRSGISGETEPLKQLGINMSVANLEAYALSQGITKSWNSMSQAEQVQLRYNYLLSATKDAQGDFNKTQDQFANQARIAKTNLAQLGATLGSKVLPFLNKGLIAFNNGLPFIEKFAAQISGPVNNAFDTVSKVAQPFIQWIGPIFKNNVSTGTSVIKTFASGLGNTFSSLSPKLSSMGKTLGESFSKMAPYIMKFFSAVGSAYVKVLPTVQKVVTFIVNVVLPPLVKLFNFIATNVVPRVANAFATYMPRIAQLINNAWSIISPILHFLIGLITVVGATVGTVALGVINFIANLAKNLFNILDGIIQFIAGVFTGNWSSAWEGVTKIFGGIFGTLGTLAKAPLNAVISLINAAIAGINQIGFTIPDWVPGMGGKQFSVNIPQIPQLAQGGYIKHRTGGILATIGEGSEDEIVSPVSKLKEFINSSSTQVPNITFSPQIIIKGNASQDDVVQALNISKSQFKRFMDDYLAGRQRLSFDQS